jgi:glucosyltransferase Lgt1/2/3
MVYYFNPHRHVKIWLSKDRDVFLNLENRMRLAKMRDINPDDVIHFFYDSKLLSPNAINELSSFCARYKILASDIRQDVLPNCKTPEEKQLIAIYEDEIENIAEGGNLAAGSDILRWLQPVYELGTYADFDVHVDTRNLPDKIPVEKPLLLSIGSYAFAGDIERIFVCNDIIAIIDSQEALNDIKKVQETISRGLSRQVTIGTTFFEDILLDSKISLSEVLQGSRSQVNLDQSDFSELSTLGVVSKGRTAREVRARVMELTENNVRFARNILAAKGISDSDADIIKAAAYLQRKAVQQEQESCPPGIRDEQIEALASIQDDNQFLSEIRERTRMALLKSSVIYASGPGALQYALFEKFFYRKDIINQEISLFSFLHYGLDKAFISGNIIPLHASSAAIVAIMQHREIGESNDLSWLEEGLQAMAIREQKIREDQVHILQDLHNIREKIEEHIKKITPDLKYSISLFSDKPRNADVHVFEKIIEHFRKGVFNAGIFIASVNDYRKLVDSDTTGKNKSQQLIDELVYVSQRAKDYLLTDEAGCVEMLATAPKPGLLTLIETQFSSL